MSDTTIINVIQPPATPVQVNVTTPPVVVVNVSQIGEKGDPGEGGGGDGLTEVTGEEITGDVTDTLELAHAAVDGTLKLFKNGVRLPVSEYSYEDEIILLVSDREATDVFIADYKYEP